MDFELLCKCNQERVEKSVDERNGSQRSGSRQAFAHRRNAHAFRCGSEKPDERSGNVGEAEGLSPSCETLTHSAAGAQEARRSGPRLSPRGGYALTTCCSRCVRRYSRGEQPQVRRNASLKRLIELKPELKATSATVMSLVASNRCAWDTRCPVR
jgi:hypothetical protein